MVHAANLNSLAENLVFAVTGRTTRDPAFRKLKDGAIKGLRDQSHARTNQFAVKDRLDGLVEKFTVLNREDLSDALETRLSKLEPSSQYMPEILSLLLELSNQPAEKTSIADVESVVKSETLAETLTWQDILAEDPLDDPEIWENVERGYHSSGEDEPMEDENSEATISTQATSVDLHSPEALARLHLTQPDETSILPVQRSRDSWQTQHDDSQAFELLELSIVREIISMAHGLPTNLFQNDNGTGRVSLARNARISTASPTTLISLLNSTANIGTALNFLRNWTKQPQPMPYLESMQTTVQSLLADFGRRLDTIEQRFAGPGEITVISVADVHTEIRSSARPLVGVSSVVKRFPSTADSPFVLLDSFYAEVSASQMSGDAMACEYLAAIFLSGFSTYLRPVSTWITTGSISPNTQESFFIEEPNEDCKPGKLWHKRFQRRRAAYMPKCVLPFADRVFALGKSQSFLQRLERDIHQSPNSDGLSTSVPTFRDIKERMARDTLVPFPQLLSNCMELWLAESSTDCTPLLCSKLLQSHGLSEVMSALPFIYFSQDGMQFQSFGNTLIQRMNQARVATTWSDRFLLTELAHDTLGMLPRVNSDNIVVKIVAAKESVSAATSLTRKLGMVDLNYSLPWPVQNITRSEAPLLHAKVFCILLQAHYAATLLSQGIFSLRSETPSFDVTLKLRQRLQCFIAIIQSHVALTAHIIHERMCAKMRAANGIDAMVTLWANYEKQLELDLLLTPNLEPVRDAIISILELAELLSKATRPGSVRSLQTQFDKSMSFLTAGVRSVSRAGGESSLELLAERLEWSMD